MTNLELLGFVKHSVLLLAPVSLLGSNNTDVSNSRDPTMSQCKDPTVSFMRGGTSTANHLRDACGLKHDCDNGEMVCK